MSRAREISKLHSVSRGSDGAVPFSLTDAALDTLDGFQFGLKDTGAVVDQTEALQKLFAEGIAANKVVDLPDGTFHYTNLTLPHVTAYDTGSPYFTGALRVRGRPNTVLKRLPGGDASFGVASKRYVDNVPYGTSPVWFEGIRFDGAGNCQDVFVDLSYGSIIKDCIFEGGTRHGLHLPVTTKNGTALLGARCCGKIVDNIFRNNGDTGLVVADAVGSAFITDFWLERNKAYDNGKRNMNIGQAAGWKILANHAWHFGIAPAPGETWGVRINNFLSATVLGNVFEGHAAQTYNLLAQINGDGAALEGVQFLLGKGLAVQFDAPATLKLDSCRFPRAGAKVAILSNTAGAIIIDEGSTYAEADPYDFVSGGFNSAVRLFANGVNAGSPPRVLNGRQRHGVLGMTAYPGLVGWDTNVDFQCDDYTPETIFASFNATGTRIGWLHTAPRAGLRYKFVRPSYATGTIQIRRPGDASAWINLGPGSTLEVAHNGFAWLPLDIGTAP